MLLLLVMLMLQLLLVLLVVVLLLLQQQRLLRGRRRCALAIALGVILQNVGTAEGDLAQRARVDGVVAFAGRRHGQAARIQQQRFDDRAFGILRMQILRRRAGGIDM